MSDGNALCTVQLKQKKSWYVKAFVASDDYSKLDCLIITFYYCFLLRHNALERRSTLTAS